MDVKYITTQNLVLRKARKSDVNSILNNIWKDEEIAKNMLWKKIDNIEEAEKRMEIVMKYHSEDYAFFVCLKETDEPIGLAGVTEVGDGIYKESGICIARKFQGRGYSKEIMHVLMKLVFEELDGKRFIYTCFSTNERSRNVCISQGFKYLESKNIIREWDNKQFSVDCYYLDKNMYKMSTTNKKVNYLVLVNKENPIEDNFIDSVELVTVDDVFGEKCQIEKTTYLAYCALKEELETKGVVIGIDSSYRSIEEQQNLMDEFIEKYGIEYAQNTVAIPRTSEHHTGLCIDIVPKVNGEWIVENDDLLKETEIFEIIHKTLPEFGFILRYMLGKEEITGYSYEPWHIRYVGKEAAKEIYDNKIALEEYI